MTATFPQQPQQAADDPLAPTPIRFTHQRDAGGVPRRRTVNGPAAGWHLEDDSEASDPLTSAARQPSRVSRPAQQARITREYHEEEFLDGDDGGASSRPPRSALRYQQTRPAQYRGQVVLPTPPQQLRRQRLTGEADAPRKPRETRRGSRPWSLYLVTGMLAITALVVGLHSLGNWWQHVQEDWIYGMPRTYQTDAVVGHNHDSSAHPSHFLALNLHGQVEVFELPAGDPTKVRVFLGPTISGDGADNVIVTISFADLGHDGTPDLILHYGDSEEVFYNKGGTFQLSGGKA